MTNRNSKGHFVKGVAPLKHKSDCGCCRCTGSSHWKGKKASKEMRKKMSDAHKGQHSSPKTQFKTGSQPWNKGTKGVCIPWNKGKKCPSISGERHHNWKNGATPKNQKVRTSLEYKLWRIAVFERDNYTCIWCGDKSGNGKAVKLNADHIKPFALFPELRLAIDNGRTLCEECHKTTNTYGGR